MIPVVYLDEAYEYVEEMSALLEQANIYLREFPLILILLLAKQLRRYILRQSPFQYRILYYDTLARD